MLLRHLLALGIVLSNAFNVYGYVRRLTGSEGVTCSPMNIDPTGKHESKVAFGLGNASVGAVSVFVCRNDDLTRLPRSVYDSVGAFEEVENVPSAIAYNLNVSEGHTQAEYSVFDDDVYCVVFRGTNKALDMETEDAVLDVDFVSGGSNLYVDEITYCTYRVLVMVSHIIFTIVWSYFCFSAGRRTLPAQLIVPFHFASRMALSLPEILYYLIKALGDVEPFFFPRFELCVQTFRALTSFLLMFTIGFGVGVVRPKCDRVFKQVLSVSLTLFIAAVYYIIRNDTADTDPSFLLIFRFFTQDLRLFLLVSFGVLLQRNVSLATNSMKREVYKSCVCILLAHTIVPRILVYLAPYLFHSYSPLFVTLSRDLGSVFTELLMIYQWIPAQSFNASVKYVPLPDSITKGY
ncbi:hypothetical protein SJAG_03816 [Schizosaccharomyces japonicus yFS275]|uniref:Uncharacterized protein n=1 Tax=Schizosaccharomyces japonicus (strain yFS275 / FY16936) TaxID=402676 RepID=B6K550_SCHJY|nr:hypothetical protein SJAG_03816 [Schizosaccharomyces japonicus yFS275]EEB08654.1 hypothetical protein SJAG_03816 [Schizosaccharomyces japonicus yFS275]